MISILQIHITVTAILYAPNFRKKNLSVSFSVTFCICIFFTFTLHILFLFSLSFFTSIYLYVIFSVASALLHSYHSSAFFPLAPPLFSISFSLFLHFLYPFHYLRLFFSPIITFSLRFCETCRYEMAIIDL